MHTRRPSKRCAPSWRPSSSKVEEGDGEKMYFRSRNLV
jgi:hypothetical protein